MDWFVRCPAAASRGGAVLTLAVGYALGRIKLGNVQRGAVAGVLIASRCDESPI